MAPNTEEVEAVRARHDRVRLVIGLVALPVFVLGMVQLGRREWAIRRFQAVVPALLARVKDPQRELTAWKAKPGPPARVLRNVLPVRAGTWRVDREAFVELSESLPDDVDDAHGLLLLDYFDDPNAMPGVDSVHRLQIRAALIDAETGECLATGLFAATSQEPDELHRVQDVPPYEAIAAWLEPFLRR